MRALLLAIVCVVFSIVCPQEPQKPATLRYKVPAGWIEEDRSSSMRVAQYKLPRTEPDTEDASLVLYYFGKDQGGTAAANVERWASQIKQADGKTPSVTETSTTSGLKVTTLNGFGTYVAETAPGSGEFLNKPGYGLRAAVIETPNGSYYLKLVGPEKTVTHWHDAFVAYLKSFEFR
jgi:hypothetical protein